MNGEDGAPDWDSTSDLLSTNQALLQLSYEGKSEAAQESFQGSTPSRRPGLKAEVIRITCPFRPVSSQHPFRKSK